MTDIAIYGFNTGKAQKKIEIIRKYFEEEKKNINWEVIDLLSVRPRNDCDHVYAVALSERAKTIVETAGLNVIFTFPDKDDDWIIAKAASELDKLIFKEEQNKLQNRIILEGIRCSTEEGYSVYIPLTTETEKADIKLSVKELDTISKAMKIFGQDKLEIVLRR